MQLTITVGKQSFSSAGASVEVFENFPIDITCTSLGSRPEAKIVWMMNNSLLEGATFRSQRNGTFFNTFSTLTLIPRRNDDVKFLECHSEVGTIENRTEIKLFVKGK